MNLNENEKKIEGRQKKKWNLSNKYNRIGQNNGWNEIERGRNSENIKEIN